jgi:glucan-binding YG repeat protein
MVTGWQTIDSQRYYFDAHGVRATGWQELDGKTYYLDATGKMVTGWQLIDEKSFYFDQDGAMSTGWQMRDGKRSYFSTDGVALTGWQKLDDKLYYFDDDGYAVTGWQELDAVRYHFGDDGAAATGWFEDETGKYFFDTSGHPYSGWLDWEGKRYYCNPDGTLYTGWMTENQDRYYFRADGSMTVGEIKIDGISHFFTSKGKYVLMCNPWHPVPEDYKIQLATVYGYQFDSTGQYALQMMIDDCREAGYYCTINNTYRSKSTQQRMWDESVADFMAAGMTKEQAEIETGKTTAIPGHSEHQTGLAVDLNGGADVYNWLAEHCWEYGFILRYPDNKIDITGIIYEPWHYRYVGPENAKQIKEAGLCLEEVQGLAE